MKKILSFLVMFSMVFGMVGTFSVQDAVAQEVEEGAKIAICHLTESESNPWSAVWVSVNANVHESHHLDFPYLGPVKESGQPDNKDKQADQWCIDNAPDDTPTDVPSLDLTKTVVYNPEKQSAAYTINWSLSGAGVDGLVLTDTLPAWTDGVVGTINPTPTPVLLPGSLNFDSNNPTSNRTIIWDLGAQSDGASGQLTFKVELWHENTCEIDANEVEAVATHGDDHSVNASASSPTIDIDSERCNDDPQEETANLIATKIVCPTENLLPNWGFGGANITSTTASTFLAENPTCYEEDWTFEWAPDQTANPGNSVGDAPAWTNFLAGVSTPVPAGAKIWVREQFDTDYIPFSGATTNLEDEASKNSAEIYCHTDVLNYDNYDWINPVQAGSTYYCVGFNVLKELPPPQCDANANSVIVSDDTVNDGDGNASELSFIHPGWTASIPGATWIWATDPVDAPTNDGDLTKVFTKTFTIVGTPTTGILDIAVDNNYSVKVNGNSVPVVFDQNNFQLETQDSYDVSSLLVSGLNTLEITATNWESVDQDPNPANNPAGLLFKLAVTNNECVTPDPETDPSADLSVDKSVVVDGSSATYTIVVTNGGPDTALDVEVSDLLPAGVTYVSDTPSTGDYDEVTGIWDIGTLLFPGNATLTIEVTIDSEVDILNVATVTSSTEDPNEENNDDDASITVEDTEDNPNDEPDNNSSISSSGSSRRSAGQVLGAATEICDWNTQYARRNWKGNIPNDVETIQNFLNQEMSAGLVVDSVFGPMTEVAVKAFQKKYMADILTPWGITTPTGIWYLSTTTKAREIMCGEKNTLPPLINWSKNPVVKR